MTKERRFQKKKYGSYMKLFLPKKNKEKTRKDVLND